MRNFRQWEKEVNDALIKTHGVGIDDIPDMPWYAWFLDEDLTIEEIVEMTIEEVNNGW